MLKQYLKVIGNNTTLIYLGEQVEHMALYIYAFTITLIVINEVLLR